MTLAALKIYLANGFTKEKLVEIIIDGYGGAGSSDDKSTVEYILRTVRR